MKEKEKSFEENLQRLETIVDELDKGEKPLDDLLKLYEEGVSLSVTLRDVLEKAEQKVIDISKKV
jgi:exodeoxyribonuclease VII small subunit